MNDPIAPSVETLSAYFDNELPPADRAQVEAYLGTHPEARTLLEDFTVLSDVGSRIDQPLPGESYWLDLPDRILVRASAEERRAPAVVAGPSPSWWQKLFSPGGSWGWATAALALVVIGGGAFLAVHESRNPINPLAGQVTPPGADPSVANTAMDADADALDEEVADLSPETYTQRVLMTLGGEGNIGVPLDIPSGSTVDTESFGDSPLQQVSQAIPPLGPQVRQEMEQVICDGPGESTLTAAFLLAMKMEEIGRYDLARKGFAVVRRQAPRNHPLFWQADYHLTFYKWANRMENSAGLQRARTMDELNRLAHQTYQRWQQSGELGDCQQAWCLNRTLFQLGQGAAHPAEVAQTGTRVNQLADCLK